MPSWCCPLRVHASSPSEPETEGFGQKVGQNSVHNEATMLNKDSVQGKMQSPIDLPLSNQDDDVAGLEAGDAYVETRPAAAAISAQGINFHVDWKEHGTGGTRLTLGDTVYEAVQFHFHTPSEHTIGGEPTAMELHFVHQSQDGGMAVVAVLFNEGEADPFLDQFWDQLPQVDVENTSADSIDIGHVDPTSLQLLRGPYYRYKGSLTTPPYTEGVEWIVMQKPLEVSKRQISAFSQTLHQSNARQVQTLHSRQVSVRQNLPEQSPIDLFDLSDECNLVQQDGDVELASGSGEAKIEPNGPNFQVTWAQDPEQKDGGANRLVVRGKVYEAVQFHFHTPSEHVVAGQAKAMELHLVHAAKDGSLAVVGIFFREGQSNAFLEQFWDHLEKLNKSDESVPVGRIDPSALEISGPYYRYRGSLTTPPYSEGVEWIVFSEEAEVSLEQLETFRQTITTPNARALQPLNHRSVSCCQ